MSGITSHVLDTSLGKPAAGISITLELANGQDWTAIGQAVTDDDGRVANLANAAVVASEYRITFEVADYFAKHDLHAFYPRVRIEFLVADPSQHYHVPLLLNPFGYSTYRGS